MLPQRYSQLLMAAGAGAVIALGVAQAQVGGDRRPAPEATMPGRLYQGTSERGNLQEALNNAVARALREMPGADRMVRYRVQDISGEQGGIRGTNTIRVNILMVEDNPGRPGRPRPEEEGRDVGPLRAVRAEVRAVPARVRAGDPVSFELTVRNTGEGPVRIPFRSGQQYDFEVSRDGRPVWRWSEGRFFTQALTSISLAPGEAKTFTGRWNLQTAGGNAVSPGTYEVRGFLTSDTEGSRVEARGTLTVTGRE